MDTTSPGTTLAIDSRDGSRNRAIANHALAAAPIPDDLRAEDVAGAIAGMYAALRPLADLEPSGIVADENQPKGFRFEGAVTLRLMTALAPIGIKINPTMSAAQSGAWLAAMIASLSDLPARIALHATRDALHVPIRFFPEVEAVIRDHAKIRDAEYRYAIKRLERLPSRHQGIEQA